MAISLKKGQKIDLTKKDGGGLTRIKVGLGWDPIEQEKKGFFASMLGSGGQEIDCDASVLMLDEKDKLVNKKDLIFFGNLKSTCGSVQHTGDNLTGEGEGDDESVNIDLAKVPSRINKMVFVVNIYNCAARKQHFGMIKNAFIRVVDNTSRSELCKYNLSDDYSGKTTLITGEIYKHNDG
ncbi:MAG: TerD family protein, partial [Deltaproteobacteria bacterium]|nr:TerD family protein [Deltaproteobacteria bacterium]